MLRDMQKIIDKVINENLERIESGKLREFVLNDDVMLVFKLTSKGIKTVVKDFIFN